MGLIKRPIGFLLEKPFPDVDFVAPQNILPKVRHPLPSNLSLCHMTQA
jgi:hypothetical protein